MKNKEKELFIKLCKFKDADAGKINALAEKHATSAVLGELFFNRMQGVAYGVLKECGLLGKVNREFRNSLAAAYEQNRIRNESFIKCAEYLTVKLKPHENDYAMLKGAYLCGKYPEGYRTSNDIDLLVRHECVTDIGKTLTENGFKQGNIRNGEFVPATRKEIIESKMTRGETVPYIKEMNLPFFKYLEVDLNFSVDYKNSEDDTVGNIVSRAVTDDALGIRIPDKQDFFIHLCCHLYKEATTLPWVKMRRDMTLYKYLDIYMLLCEYTDDDITEIFKRAGELGVADICACVILWTCEIMEHENRYAMKLSEIVLTGKAEMLDTVVAPAEHKEYIYTEKDILKRFFAPDRTKLLTERKTK